jgi:tetratricopeptide (TPR) repeat protein
MRIGRPKLADELHVSLASDIYFLNCWIVAQMDLFAYIYGSIRLALIAKYSDDLDAIALSHSKYAMNLSLSGAMGQLFAKRYIRDTLARLDRCKSPFVKALSKHNIASSLYCHGDLDTAEKYLLEIQDELEKAKDWHSGLNLHVRRHIASQRGDATAIETIAEKELRFGELIQDQSICAWGKYGLADAWSRRGKFEEAIQYAREALEMVRKHFTRSVASQELGRALLQGSQYDESEQILRNGIKQMHSDFFYFDYSMQLFSLHTEAIVGAEWSRGSKVVSRDKQRRGNRAASKARFWAMFFPNMRAHTYRVSGRAAAACGKTGKALRYFDRALKEATKFGNRSEYARTLIDKSRLIDGEESARLREEGLKRLQELHNVLPDAERF